MDSDTWALDLESAMALLSAPVQRAWLLTMLTSLD